MIRILSISALAFLLFSCDAEPSQKATEEISAKTTETPAKAKENTTKKIETKAPDRKPDVKKQAEKPVAKKKAVEPVIITDANFEQLVLKSDKIVLIDFWAVWCGPCKRVAPIIKEFAAEYEGRAVIGKLDVDKNPGIAQKYQINSIPTILIFKNGQPVDGAVGAHPKATLKSKLDKALNS
jgi:thioredoxin 1